MVVGQVVRGIPRRELSEGDGCRWHDHEMRHRHHPASRERWTETSAARLPNFFQSGARWQEGFACVGQTRLGHADQVSTKLLRSRTQRVYNRRLAWDVRIDEQVGLWLDDPDKDSYEQVIAALNVLRDIGPQLGRPLFDSVAGTRPSGT